jgi:hypothetical protein
LTLTSSFFAASAAFNHAQCLPLSLSLNLLSSSDLSSPISSSVLATESRRQSSSSMSQLPSAMFWICLPRIKVNIGHFNNQCCNFHKRTASQCLRVKRAFSKPHERIQKHPLETDLVKNTVYIADQLVRRWPDRSCTFLNAFQEDERFSLLLRVGALSPPLLLSLLLSFLPK